MKKIFVLFIAAALAISSMTGCAKVVKIGEEGKLTGEQQFNAGKDVSGIWDSKILPELTGKAVDLATFYKEANGKLASLANKYGKYSMGTSGTLNYTVKGTGTVQEVDTKSKAGFMLVTVDGYTGPIVTKIQIGTVYLGTAIRDSLSIIKFEDYKNQVDYAAVSQSIHKTIQDTVINKIDLTKIKGKKIDFTGCFTVDNDKEILITPVVLNVK